MENARESIAELMEALANQITHLTLQIKETIGDTDLRGKRDLIESIDGIGPATSSRYSEERRISMPFAVLRR